MPTVSVCVPTFNGERYLRPCLDSILCQTYQDFELLLVDDCSTDSTQAILHEYARQDARVRVVLNDHNHGLVGNWNYCTEIVNGEWVKFVFQDDLLLPNCIEYLLSAAPPTANIIFSSRDFIFEDGTTQSVIDEYTLGRDAIEALWSDTNLITPQAFGEATLNHIGVNLVGEPSVVMLRRELFARFGLFNPHLIVACDLEYWTRVGIHTGLHYVPERLACFRVHENATTAKSRVSRSYQMDVLDDLILLHEFVFNPEYEPLRLMALKHNPPLDLMRLFQEKAQWAKNVADHKLKRGDHSFFDAWQEIADIYPNIRPQARNNPFKRLWQKAADVRHNRSNKYASGKK